jgi:hypothetical protein
MILKIISITNLRNELMDVRMAKCLDGNDFSLLLTD